MTITPRTYTLLAFGKTGADIARGVTSADVAVGVYDRDRPGAGLPLALANGCVNVSPSAAHLSRGQSWLVGNMFQEAGDAHVVAAVTSGVTSVFLDSAYALQAALARYRKRFGDERLVLVQDSTDGDAAPVSSAEALRIRYDRASEFVSKVSYERFVQVMARLVDSLYVASRQYAANPTFGQLAEWLAAADATFGLRFHMEICPSTRLVPLFGPIMSRLNGYTPAYAEPQVLLDQAKTALQVALSEPSAAATATSPNPDARMAAVFDLPLPTRHRAFGPLVEELDAWIRRSHPNAVGVFASANGVSLDPKRANERWVQVSVIQALPGTSGATPRSRGRKAQGAA
jgi:hypothetical protein